jgi:hypothetical protein
VNDTTNKFNSSGRYQEATAIGKCSSKQQQQRVVSFSADGRKQFWQMKYAVAA